MQFLEKDVNIFDLPSNYVLCRVVSEKNLGDKDYEDVFTKKFPKMKGRIIAYMERQKHCIQWDGGIAFYVAHVGNSEDKIVISLVLDDKSNYKAEKDFRGALWGGFMNLRLFMEQHKLTDVAFSNKNFNIDPYQEAVKDVFKNTNINITKCD